MKKVLDRTRQIDRTSKKSYKIIDLKAPPPPSFGNIQQAISDICKKKNTIGKTHMNGIF